MNMKIRYAARLKVIILALSLLLLVAIWVSLPSLTKNKNTAQIEVKSPVHFSSYPYFSYLPNIVLITIDTLRADHLGSYGYPRSTTPELDHLARQSVQFTRIISQAPWTLPSIISTFTGFTPLVHDVLQETSKVPDSLETLPELLQKNNYFTSGVINHLYLSRKYNFQHGFDFFDDSLLGHENAVSAPAVADMTIQWLQNNEEKPFFLFTHFFDPHSNYVPPRIYKKMFFGPQEATTRGNPQDCPREKIPELLDLYDGEVRHTDKQVGRIIFFLKQHNQWRDLMLICNADHGEEFGDDGSTGHLFLRHEILNVP
ncbi:sulfatase [candidate division CSSED10-310 bacterium]|uniref:Sulfatase n=1 Tax=candidate division CSSED10-310 bacterium TaxID=2855610 RepID=A0ABV6YZ47_UNCC1